MTGDLVHRAVRSEIREVASGCGTIERIACAFQDFGFGSAAAAHGFGLEDPTCRETFDDYAASVDWTNAGHVQRALGALSSILDRADEGRVAAAMRVLNRHGVELDKRDQLRLVSSRLLDELPLHVLDDPGALSEHLERMRRVAGEDPPAAISAAKALIEATLKRVLHELDHPVSERDDLPALAKAAHKALAVDVGAIAPTQTGAEIIRRTLGALVQIPLILGELRNTYGPDHGRLAPTVGLHQRHADLAVGSATTYVRFVLATLANRTTARS